MILYCQLKFFEFQNYDENNFSVILNLLDKTFAFLPSSNLPFSKRQPILFNKLYNTHGEIGKNERLHFIKEKMEAPAERN